MIKKVFLIVFSIFTTCLSQDEISGMDIFVIDSYVTPEEPHRVMLTFFTSEKVKAKIKFDGNDELVVSSEYLEEHKFELLLSKLNYDSTSIPYKIIVENSSGVKSTSDEFDLYLPEVYTFEIKNKSNFLDLCLGGILYLLPSPTFVLQSNESNFSLNKELPIISFYGSGYNFPSSYIALEYSYIFDVKNRNYFRVGYKYIFQTKIIKYVSPGINLTTNFNGFNGISPEVSFGLFKFYETFTLYTRFRYNYNFNNAPYNFAELSIGLFTSSISFNF
ncbi:MAG: hypothetical protein L3J41_15975 [Melioribacteraceae bacterium]|nr:hypothetical protein [Melioribacteraceae bacterium]